MFRWFRTFTTRRAKAQGEQDLQRTIEQLQACREKLAQLIIEARLTHEMLGVTEEELTNEMHRTMKPAVVLAPRTFSPEDRQRGA